MKITGLEIWPIRIPYKAAYTTSRGTVAQAEGVVIRIATDAGITGAGEASFLFPDRSGETIETVPEILQHRLGPLLIGRDPFDIEGAMEAFDRACGEQFTFPYSRAAIDLALFDLMGKAQGVPVAQLLGGISRPRLSVGRSLPIAPPDQTVEIACMLRERGYRGLTLKGSAEWRGDIERFVAVRRAMGDDFPLEIDPNQAYSVEQAIEVARTLEPLGIANIEQPCAWWDLEGMARITAATSVTIAADETVMCSADVATVARLRAADMVTIKLARVGGITEARRMVDIARKAGLACNMGSKHTFGVGTAAILHFCAAIGHVCEPLGYGSALERFVDDVIEEEIPFANGIASLPQGAGLGVTLCEEKLARYTAGTKRRVGT